MKTLGLSMALGSVAYLAFPVAVDAVLRGLLLCAAVILFAACIQRASASLRYSTWMGLMAGLLMLPAGLILLPKWSVLPEWAAVSFSDEVINRESIGNEVTVVSPSSKRDEADHNRVPTQLSTEPIRASRFDAARRADVLPTVERDVVFEPQPLERHGEAFTDNQFPQPTRVTNVAELKTQTVEDDTLVVSAETENVPTVAKEAQAEFNESPVPQTGASHESHAKPSLLVWTIWAVSIWCFGVTVIALRLLLGQATSMRLTKRFSRLDSSEWTSLLSDLCLRLGVAFGNNERPRITIWKSAERVVPMTWGTWRPKIVLPSDVTTWSEARLEAVLLHELAHIKRRDCLWQWVAHLATAVYWINPLVWFAAVRMRADRECACDDMVLATGISGAEYAKHLVSVSADYPASNWASPLAIAMSRRSGFEERVGSLLNNNKSRGQVSWLSGSVLVVMLLGLVVPLSMLMTATSVSANPTPAKITQNGANENAESSPPTQAKVKGEAKSTTKAVRTNVGSTVKASDLKYSVTPQKESIGRNGSLWCETSLTNNSKQPITVYWGDYAYPDMYRFDITHESGRRIPNLRYWPPIQGVPSASRPKHMPRIEPGKSVVYKMLLTPSPGANCQTTYFDAPGKYTIKPSLKLATHSVIDATASTVKRVPTAWTGELTAEPFTINVTNVDASVVPNIKDDLIERIGLTGQVLSNSGKPVSGAVLRIFHRRPSFGGYDGFSTQTLGQTAADEHGKFAFTRLPASSPNFRIDAWHPEQPMTSVTIANDGKSKDLTASVKFSKAVVITGTVVDAMDQPISGARVNSLTMTDDRGKFRFVAAAGQDQYRLSVHHSVFNPSYSPVSADEALGGSLKVKLLSKNATTISGIAVFADGGELPFTHMTCHYAPVDTDDPNAVRADRVETDGNGLFQLTLPDAREYRVTLLAEKGEPGQRHLVHRAWISHEQRTGGMAKDVKFTFENRGELRVKLAAEKPLPDFVRFRVDCHLLHNRNRIHVARKTGLKAGDDISFEQLSPGRYSVNVVVEPDSALSWHREVEITTSPLRPRTATFELPALEYGNVRTSVVDEKGQAVPSVLVRLGSSGSSHREHTDKQGQVAFDRVFAGRVHVSVQAPGYATARTTGRVIGGREVTFDPIVLKPASDESGWVAGRLLYDDGTPVRGTVVGGFGGEMVDADGRFRQRMSRGKQELQFELPVPTSKMTAHSWVGFRPRNRTMLASFDIKAGKTIEQDIRIPRNPNGQLKVLWEGDVPTGAYLTLDVEAGNLLFRQVANVGEKQNSHTFEELPPGARTVLLTNWQNKRLHLVGALAANAPAKDGKQEIKLDANNVGTFALRVFDTERRPVDDVEFSLALSLDGKKVHLIQWQGFGLPQLRNEPKNKRPTLVRKLDDGTLVVTNLQAGQYSLTAKRDKWSDTGTFTIKPAGGALIELHMGPNGQPGKPAKVKDLDTLLEQLQSQYVPIRAAAIVQLKQRAVSIDPNGDSAKLLVEALEDERWVSLRVVGWHGSTTIANYAENALVNLGGTAVSALVSGLEQGNAVGRRHAASVLGKLGYNASSGVVLQTASVYVAETPGDVEPSDLKIAVQPLIKQFTYEDRQVQGAAASALGRIAVALPALIEVIDDGTAQERKLAASALGKHKTDRATEALIRALDHENEDVRVWAAYSLESSQQDAKFTAKIIDQLADDSRKVRQSLTTALWRIGGDAVEPLLVGLGNEDWRIRAGCAYAVAHTLSHNRTAKAIDPIRKCLHDEHAEVRLNAFWALRDCVYIAERDVVVTEMITGLKDKDVSVRSAAANVVGTAAQQWPKDKRPVEPLIALLGDANNDLVNNCITALGEYKDKRAVEPLLALVPDADETRRTQLLNALASIGDRRAIPFMRSAFANKHVAAIRSLGKMGDTESVPQLVSLLGDSNKDVRQAAVQAFEDMPDERAAEALIKILKSEANTFQQRGFQSRYVFESTARALANTGSPTAATTMVELCDVVHSAVANQRMSFEEFEQNRDYFEMDVYRHPFASPLYGMGLAAKPALIEGVQNGGRATREVCLYAIYNMAVQGGTKRSDFNDVIPVLTKTLDDREPTVRRLAAKCLGHLQVKSAVPRLLKLLEDPVHADYRKEMEQRLKVLPQGHPSRAEISKQPSFVIREVCRVLSWIGDEQSAPALVNLLSHDDAEVQIAVARSLGLARDAAIVDKMIEALNRPHLIEPIAGALGYTGDKRAIPHLRQALQSSDTSVRIAAAKSLGNLAAIEAEADLLKQLRALNRDLKVDSPEFKLRVNCIVSLLEMNSEMAAEFLKPAFKDVDITSRRRLASAISISAKGAKWRPETRFQNKAVLDELRRVALQDGHPVVRLYAVGALAGQSDQATIDTLKAALSDWSEFVQKDARALLDEMQK